MDNNHMHNIIALFSFFACCWLLMEAYGFGASMIKRIALKKCKYGSVKAGDIITPKENKND